MEMYIKQKHFSPLPKRLPEPSRGENGFAALWRKVDVFVLEKEMKGRSELVVFLPHDAS